MTFRRLCQSLALLLLLHPTAAPAIEALTTTAEEVNVKKRLETKVRERAQAEQTLRRSETTLLAIEPPTDPILDGIRFALEYQAATTSVSVDQAKLAEAEAQAKAQREKADHDLQAIPISANVQINSGGSASAVVPGIDASASFPISKSLDCQMLFSIKPDPPAGTTADVTQSIRMSTGVFSANLGLNYNYFWMGDKDPQGPLGVEARLGLPVAYQRAASTDPPASGQSSTSSTDFGLLSPEIKLSVWLKYVLLGYKYVYYFAFGNSNAVYEEIDRTGSHKIYLAAKLQALSGSDRTPFYVEANYTSGKNGFSGGAFSFAVSKSLSWNPR